MEWEIFVDSAEGGDEVILEGSNGTFSGVASVHSRRGQLEVDAFVV
jgi:hypothetical protein